MSSRDVPRRRALLLLAAVRVFLGIRRHTRGRAYAQVDTCMAERYGPWVQTWQSARVGPEGSGLDCRSPRCDGSGDRRDPRRARPGPRSCVQPNHPPAETTAAGRSTISAVRLLTHDAWLTEIRALR